MYIHKTQKRLVTMWVWNQLEYEDSGESRGKEEEAEFRGANKCGGDMCSTSKRKGSSWSGEFYSDGTEYKAALD
jgi:hypothetical protein